MQWEGEIVLHFNWPFAVHSLRRHDQMGHPNRTAPLPAGPAGRATFLGGSFLAVSAVSSNAEKATKFVQAMTCA
jgi:ABC-type glycerol-3-phosphate transport system substrate-binding protein